MEAIDRPFSQAADPAYHVILAPFESILVELEEAIRAGDGLSVLTGAPGSGKTHCVRVLMRRLGDEAVRPDGGAPGGEADSDGTDVESRASYRVILLEAVGLATRRATLQAALHQLGLPYVGLCEQEARLQLLDAARTCVDAGNPLVLILDEADRASHRILEDLRCLTNFVHRGEPLFRVFLVGDTRLEEELGTSSLEAVNHRIVCQTTLSKLSVEHSAEYIEKRMRLAGCSASDRFDDDAIDAICDIAAGSPRAINMLAEKTLELASATQVQVDEPDVEGDGSQQAEVFSDSGVTTGEHDDSRASVIGRDQVIKAFGALENLPVSWRRPLIDDDGFFWTQKRRGDELTDLEPIDGEVVEIGGEADQPIPQSPVPRSMDALSPLRRMHEILGDCEESASFLETFGTSQLAPGASQLTAEDATYGSDANQLTESQAQEPVLSDEPTEFCSPADADDAQEAEVDVAAVERDSVDLDSVELNSEIPSDTEQVLGAFAEPLRTNADDPELPVTAELSTTPAPTPMLGEIPIENASDSNVPDEAASASFGDGELNEAADSETTAGDVRDHAESASQLVDAMLPLVENEQPDETQVAALEALLDESADGSRASGEEDKLGGETLDLVAQISAAVGPPQAADRSDRDDLPGFAFEDDREASAGEKMSDDVWANEETLVGLSHVPTESSVPTTVNADEPNDSGFEHRYDRGEEQSQSGRLVGLFTRLRASRNRSR